MKREEAIRLLRGGEEGVAEWNLKRPTPVIAFDDGAMEVSGIVDLSDADLQGAKLNFANLQRVIFTGANLDKTELFGRFR